MSVLQLLKSCFFLLDRPDRVKLAVVTVAQMVLGLLDLAGVALVGTVGVLSVSALSGQDVPTQVQRFLPNVSTGASDSISVILILSALAGLLLILKSAFSFLLAKRTYQFLAQKQAAVSLRATTALLTRPISVLQEKASQDTAFVLTAGFGAAITVILGGTATAIADIALLVIFGSALLVVDPLVSIFAIAYFSAIAWILYKSLKRRATQLGVEGTNLDISTYMLVQDAIQSYREVVALNRRILYVQRMEQMQSRLAAVATGSQVVTVLPRYAFEAALVFGALVLALVQFTTADATQAVGVLALFIAAASRVTPAILRLQGAGTSIRRAQASAEKALDLEERVSSISGRAPAPLDMSAMHDNILASHPGFVPSLKVASVSLRYAPDARWALKDVSFTVEAGMAVGVVGMTGAGKSTLADVVLGVASPEEGTTLISGVEPLEAISRWPGAVAYVPQSVAIMGGSVRENVAYGIPSHQIDDDLVLEALERAHLSEFLHTFRDGLETVVGEDGVRLSGGQRQRLGIARALYSRPRLIVLDEATSALDSETENAITETIYGLGESVTTLTIAHRLATIRHSDLIVFLDSGQVTASGTFDQVRSQSPAFDRQARLLNL
mgnify:CR=1 FL=1